MLYFIFSIVRTPSLSTFDSLEMGRYSDDGRDADEKVAGTTIYIYRERESILQLEYIS